MLFVGLSFNEVERCVISWGIKRGRPTATPTLYGRVNQALLPWRSAHFSASSSQPSMRT